MASWLMRMVSSSGKSSRKRRAICSGLHAVAHRRCCRRPCRRPFHPGEGNAPRPDRSERRFRTVIATSSLKVLRRPLELGQYVSIRYTERLAAAGIEPSVGSVGDSFDNALAETINGLYKAEVIHRRGPWRSFEAVEFATLEWVDWFNHRRLLEPIGNLPPAEAEARYYAQREGPARAAGSKPKCLRETRRGSVAGIQDHHLEGPGGPPGCSRT